LQCFLLHDVFLRNEMYGHHNHSTSCSSISDIDTSFISFSISLPPWFLMYFIFEKKITLIGSQRESVFYPPHLISHTIFSFVRKISLCNSPHPLLLTFLRFDYHVFCEFTICLLKNPSILYWAIFFDLSTAFFDN
jgi:hypothetical protein